MQTPGRGTAALGARPDTESGEHLWAWRTRRSTSGAVRSGFPGRAGGAAPEVGRVADPTQSASLCLEARGPAGNPCSCESAGAHGDKCQL